MHFEYKQVKEILEIVSNFRNSYSIAFSNYYGLDNNFNYEVFKSEKTLMIRNKEHHFYRLYILSSDEKDLKNSLSELTGVEYVINIPIKQPIGDEVIQLLNESGFELIGEYYRYFNKSIEPAYSFLCKMANGLETDSNCELSQIARIDEIDQIEKLLRDNFSLYTDHLLDETELRDRIRQNTVYVNRYNGEVCGVEIFTPTSRVCYSNAWIDKKGLGVFLSKEVYHYLIDHGIKVLNFWVSSTNKPAIKYYKKLGCVPDGLIDYSFLKK